MSVSTALYILQINKPVSGFAEIPSTFICPIKAVEISPKGVQVTSFTLMDQ